MAFVHSSNSRVLLGTFPISGYLRGYEVSNEREFADVTVLTDASGHRFLPGLDNGTLSLDGLFDDGSAAGTLDDALNTALAGGITVVTAAPAGFVVGNRVNSLDVRDTNYAYSSQIGDAVAFGSSWQAEGLVDSGVALTTHAAVSATANGTAVDNTASSANGAVGALHVTANTRNGTVIVKVQHSVDNSVWVDLITFTTVGASTATAERVAVTGTVNRYLRATWTVAGSTGSATIAVAACRR